MTTTIKADADDIAIDPEYYDQIERAVARRYTARIRNIRRDQQRVGNRA